MRRYIPRDIATSETFSSVNFPDYRQLSFRSKPGDPHSHKVRVVCRRCNSGWMSEVQTATKPHLVPLIDGTPCTIERYPQGLLALWSAMAIMAAEFQEPEKVAITADHRTHLRLYKEPPSNWRIWIGHYERGDWNPRWFHTTLPVASKEHVPDTMDNGLPRPNTQTTTFIVGSLFIHAMSSALPGVVDAQIDWPPAALTDSEAYFTSKVFFDWALGKTGRGSG